MGLHSWDMSFTKASYPFFFSSCPSRVRQKARVGWSWIIALLLIWDKALLKSFSVESGPLLWRGHWAYFLTITFPLAKDFEMIFLGSSLWELGLVPRGEIHGKCRGLLKLQPPGISHCYASLYSTSRSSSE